MRNLNEKMELIGSNIRKAREKSGLSRGKFSQLSDISVPHLYRIEKGQSTYQAQLLIKLSILLETDISEFFKGV